MKNANPGQVKTRLAKTIGNEGALKVYEHLLDITENAVNQISCDKHIYFSNIIIEEKWGKPTKFIQKGAILGEKMQNAFKNGFNKGYEKIILIGSDLPDLTSEIIAESFFALDKAETVFGPAEDGGYYLVGMKKPHKFIFENKPWSESCLLEKTLSELSEKDVSTVLLKTLNDIDTFEDLKTSKIYKNEKFHFNH